MEQLRVFTENVTFKVLISFIMWREFYEVAFYFRSVQIRNFFWSVFFRIRTENLLQIRESMDQKNSVFGDTFHAKGPPLFHLLQFNPLSFFSNGQNQDKLVTVSLRNSS